MGQVAESQLKTGPGGAEARQTSLVSRIRSRLHAPRAARDGAYLERGWVIANHKLVSFHAAFISSILSLPAVELTQRAAAGENIKSVVLGFMFLPTHKELWISLAILYLSWHIAIAIHEMGHFLVAAKLTALNKDSQEKADAVLKSSGSKLGYYAQMFLQIPWGKFYGVKKEHGNFVPDAPYNLAVAAAAPVWSGWLATFFLPAAILFIAVGLLKQWDPLIYIGRFFLAPGCVGLLDRLLADPGKLREFRTREKRAAEQAARAAAAASKEAWPVQVAAVKQRLLTSRITQVTLKDGNRVAAPWQFRNCAMGGRHTEKEYPESNISMQESMFMPLSPKTYEDAQEMTVKLQYRLKEIIESAPGAKVMGVGLEGGIAPYVDKAEGDKVPEQRMWRFMKQAILDCEWVPGVDVAIALDPACSELENAYREERGEPDSVGMYRFWRDKSKVEMSRDDILNLYKQAMEEGIPILSIEDGFGERDHQGWKNLMKELGDKIFIIGDDLVTTKDSNIENCARNGEINASLIKANQIGTLTETVLAMLTSLAYGAELVISHRSKSPNDPFEAEIGTAMNALGVKCGGGANTERLQKYGRMMEILALARATQRETTAKERKEIEESVKEIVRTLTGRDDVAISPKAGDVDITALLMKMLAIEAVSGTEEATNAGIPSAAATLFLGKSGIIRFKGSTPLGTSAGEDEAIHYVDSIIEPSDTVKKYPDLFKAAGDGTFRFKKDVKADAVRAKNDEKLTGLWKKSRRYDGKGCMDAVQHIETVLAKAFVGKKVGTLGSLLETDRQLLGLELEQAIAAGRISKDASKDEKIHAMQRKGVLGMNAILSMSLALGRAVAAADGRELWQLTRDIASDTMAKFIVANGGKKSLAELRKLDFDQLTIQYRETAAQCVKSGKTIYELLRAQLPVYPV
jgi:enolase